MALRLRAAASAMCVCAVAGCGRESANHPPIARAGDDLQVFRGAAVAIDASVASTDPDGEELVFAWTQLSGAAVTIPSDSAVLSFDADTTGSLVFLLTVSDGSASSTDIVSVLVRNDLQVTSIVPVETAEVTGSQPLAVFFNAPIRPWTAAASVIVEDVTDTLLPVPVLGNVTVEDGGTVVLFTPAAAWAGGVPYLLTVTTAPMGLDGAPLRDAVFRNVAGSATDDTPPTVLWETPGPNATGVAISSSIELIFSEPVAPATLGAFGLADAALAARDGAVRLTAGGMRAVFTPADTVPDPDNPETLAPSTAYVLTVLDTLTDVAGRQLDGDESGVEGGNYVLNFQTAAGADITPPRIVHVSPLLGAQGISVKLPTVITFDEPIEPSTLAGAFTVGSNGVAAAGTVSTLLGNTVAVFTPAANLATGARYDISLAGTVADLSGNILGSPFSSYYTTGASPPPTVTTILPDFSPKDQTVSVEIQGADFEPGASVVVLGGGVIVGNTTVVAGDAILTDLTLSPFAAVGARSISVTNPDGQSGTGFGIFQILEKTPEISSINPAAGSEGELDKAISIFGEGFLSGASVAFSPAGGITFDSTTVVSATRIDVVIDIPAGATLGTRDVTVTNLDNQTATETAAFLVQGPPPTVTSCTPGQGAQGTVVTGLVVNGSGIQPVPLPGVSFGPGTAVEVLSATTTSVSVNLTILATAALGLRDVTVINADGQSGVGTSVFEVLDPPPVITSLSPAVGSQTQSNLVVSVFGSGFLAGATVSFAPTSGITFDSTTVLSSSQINIQIDISGTATLGLRDVTVTNTDGQSDTATGAFTVRLPAPTVTDAVPNQGGQGTTLFGVVVNGTNFQTAPLPTVSFGSGTVASVNSATATTINLDLSISAAAPKTTRDVVVTNTDGQSGTGVGDFTVLDPPPRITSLTPAVGSRNASGLVVSIFGSGFLTGANATIAGTGITENSTTVMSSSQIDLNIDISGTATLGLRDVTVANTDGQSHIATGAFTVRLPPPTVTSASPTSGVQGTTLFGVSVTGSNFQISPLPTVSFGGGTAATVLTATATTITLDLTISASATLGLRDVIVVNTDGQSGTATGAFTVNAPPPTVTAAAPGASSFIARQSPTVELFISGTGFDCSGTGPTFEVRRLGSASAGVTEDNAGAPITCSSTLFSRNVTVDATAVVGFHDVRVTNLDAQQGTGTGVLEIRAETPTFTSASPNPKQGETRDVTVTGTFFQPGATAATTAGTVNSVSFVTATTLNVNITVPFATATGSYDITVTNPDSQFVVGTAGLTVDQAPAPSISSCSPANGAQGQTLDVTVTGDFFQPLGTVTFSGTLVTVNTRTFVSPTTLTLNVTIDAAAALGGRTVTVTNTSSTPNQMTTSGTVFTVVATLPTVTSVSPPDGAQNTSGLVLTIGGTNFSNTPTPPTVAFSPSTGITSCGTATFVSSTQITCSIDIGVSAPTGFRDVTVTNADGGSGTLANGFQVTSSGGAPTVSSIERHPDDLPPGGTINYHRLDTANSLRYGQTGMLFHILGAGFPTSPTIPVVSISGTGVTVGAVTPISSSRIDVLLSINCADAPLPGVRDVTVTNPSNGLSGTLPNGFVVRHGVVINELNTDPRTKHSSCSDYPNTETIEVFNGSSCSFNITNWRFDFVDNVITGYEFGALADGREVFSTGGSFATFPAGAYLMVIGPDYIGNNNNSNTTPTGNNNSHLNVSNNMANKIFVSLFTVGGLYIDDVEIGDNEENDSGTDGAPASGNDGAAAGANDEMVARCPNGNDTDDDIADFYQNEEGGPPAPDPLQAATNFSTNNTECPECANDVDDDGDGWIDLLDPGCTSPTDPTEGTGGAVECSDGIDNGDPEDSLIDEADPDCFSGKDTSETR